MSVQKGNALINLSEKLGFLQKEVVAIGDSNFRYDGKSRIFYCNGECF
ncbi:MAG: hypothetical protein K2M46_03435 [Lachnospiraceae bacterium]|nr:hypothetical protein [Lachnospiraceae bacterium]